MSCNGCRVLRKGCNEDCVLRPSLQWISSSQSQANATLFLAKFYGRAGLINLIHAGPSRLRPVIFESLLYEACGRIIDPVHGSVGLMSSGYWTQCQAAVEAVLKGASITTMLGGSGEDDSSSASVRKSIAPLQGCDIRHLSKDASAASRLRIQNRQRFKRSRSAKRDVELAASEFSDAKFTITGWDSGEDFPGELKRAGSQDSSSVETVEQDLVNRVEPGPDYKPVSFDSGIEIQLELTLGFNRVCDTLR